MLPLSAAALRRELSARALAWAEHHPHEYTPAHTPSVLFAPTPEGLHGNFLPSSWRRIARHPAWLARVGKTYTSTRRLPWARARPRHELDAATSSDALLMNVFCYPGLLRRPAVCALLGLPSGVRPRFGVRLRVPLHRNLLDRTEADLLLRASPRTASENPDNPSHDSSHDPSHDLLIEAKLTETGFQTASARLLSRYRDLDTVFDLDALPRLHNGHIAGYQLLRSTLAAHARGCRFAVLSDARRRDLTEQFFLVLRAVRSSIPHAPDLRSRLQLITWQELAAASPRPLQRFLAEKYGIEPRP